MRLGRLLGLWTATAVTGLALTALPGAPAQASGNASPTGPDVSSHQHPSGRAIDWAKVHSAGLGFAFVKATEGHTYTNPYFNNDYPAAASAGLIRSAYHYPRPALPVSSARQQADYFVSVVGSSWQKGDLPTTLDMEESGGLGSADLVSWAKTFLARVTQLTGRPPIIYTYPYFWRHAMGDSHDFTSYPLWIADYSHGSAPRALPGGWSTWTFWQTTASGHVSGIPTTVDLDRFNGDTAALQRMASRPATPAPTPLLPVPIPTALPTLSAPLPPA